MNHSAIHGRLPSAYHRLHSLSQHHALILSADSANIPDRKAVSHCPGSEWCARMVRGMSFSALHGWKSSEFALVTVAQMSDPLGRAIAHIPSPILQALGTVAESIDTHVRTQRKIFLSLRQFQAKGLIVSSRHNHSYPVRLCSLRRLFCRKTSLLCVLVCAYGAPIM
ncbi:hypothetical protein CC78DRAFT_277905 [Lojkania enalia]|uniref:Uncharacterized protein n=1 Tax=Lojkania enalia TaxID=147567 RepID=A0A9P4TNC5_9PLEO|nr:hypothetical protein CC78DRAFT_277905 [Didymosphaeria enalia]